MERRELAPGIFTIRGVLTADECQQAISSAEKRGFDRPIINAGGAKRWDLDQRNSDRPADDDLDFSKRLWSRVKELMPARFNDRPLQGFNDRVQYYRYVPGQKFSWHYDGHITKYDGEESFLTFMIYLNEGYEGGATRFESVSVGCEPGMALVYEHDLIHQDDEVTDGVKHVFRTDVMYGPAVERNVRPWAWPETFTSDKVPFVETCWQRCKEHYHVLWLKQPTGRDGGRAKNMLWSMRDLVERIAPLAIADNIYPWNSHSHAQLVLRKGQPAARERLVHLWCGGRESRVRVGWYKDRRRVMLTVNALDDARWRRIVSWLETAKTGA